MRRSGAARFSLPGQSNSAVAEFDMFGAEIGLVRFRMEGRVGYFPGTALRGSPHPARKRAALSPKRGRDSAAAIGLIIVLRKAELQT